MKSNFPKLSLFISVILIVFSCFAFVFLYKQVNTNNTSAEVTLTEWQKEENRRNEIISLQNSMASIEADKILLETHFAKSSDVVPFLNLLEALAPLVGAKAEIVLLGIADDKKSLVVDLKATGSFESLYRFLRLLENSPYELKFDSMNLQKSGSQSSSDEIDPIVEWSLSLQIRLLTFTL